MSTFAAVAPSEATVSGHAARFESLSQDLGGFRELLQPGAFGAALAGNPDVRLLLNHDSNFVLGRTKAGTLRVSEDSTGLATEARVDLGISWIADLYRSMQRRDITQASFAFSINDGGDEWLTTEDGEVVRLITPDGVRELFDVSIVTYPAYESAELGMRQRHTGAGALRAKRPDSQQRSASRSAARARNLALSRARVAMTATPRLNSKTLVRDARVHLVRRSAPRPGRNMTPIEIAFRLRLLGFQSCTGLTRSATITRLEEAGLYIAKESR